MSWNENESSRSAQYVVGLRLLPDGDFAFTGRSSVVVKNETRVMPGSQGFSSFASPSREPHRNSREADGAHDENHSSDDHSGRGADHVGYLDGRGSWVCVSVRRGLVSRRGALLAASADDARGHLCRTLPMRNSGSGSVSSILTRCKSSLQALNAVPRRMPVSSGRFIRFRADIIMSAWCSAAGNGEVQRARAEMRRPATSAGMRRAHWWGCQ